MSRLLFVLTVFVIFAMMAFAQETKTLLADGTADAPKKHALQPTVETLSPQEIAVAETEALRAESLINPLPQASDEETRFRRNFHIEDVAKGYFIYREIQFHALLYTAYSPTHKRNYQGIIVLRVLANATKFTVAAHYAYHYRGDKYLRALPDINHNVLNELAVFSEPPTKKIQHRYVRIVEFAPDGLLKLGGKAIYTRVNRPQRTPWNRDGNPPAKRVYTPPDISALKLFASGGLGEQLIFHEEHWKRFNDSWGRNEKPGLRETALDADSVNYLEIAKPLFPKGPGEK